MLALNTVDIDGATSINRANERGLSGRLNELLQDRTGVPSDERLLQSQAGKLHESRAKAVARTALVPLDIAPASERHQHRVHRALAQTEPRAQLSEAERRGHR